MFDKLIDLIISLWDNLKPIVFVMQGNKACMYRGGNFLKALEYGTYLRIPFVDTITQQNAANKTICIREVNITTKDGKSISIAAKFNAKIEDIYKAVVLTDNWQANIVDVGRGIISKELINYTWEEICHSDIEVKIGGMITGEGNKIGVEIWNFAFTDKLNIFGLKLFNS